MSYKAALLSKKVPAKPEIPKGGMVTAIIRNIEHEKINETETTSSVIAIPKGRLLFYSWSLV